MRKLRVFLLTVALTAACSHSGAAPEPKARLSRAQFVSVMVELNRTEPRLRAAILQKRHVSESDLQDFVKNYAASPAYLGLAFDSIQAGIDRPLMTTH